ncbi:MAG TPA: response regulator [Candidatus Limnocylindria bacterium]|nr:response regulator [Candidatus Limnocylindria bacterium]
MNSAPLAVMVIDDDPSMRSLLVDYLSRQGFDVTTQPSGEAAVAALEVERVDAVVVDKEMPGMNGLDFVSYVRGRRPELPIVLITAFGGAHVRREALARGASRYLEKPFHLKELGAVLSEAAVRLP